MAENPISTFFFVFVVAFAFVFFASFDGEVEFSKEVETEKFAAGVFRPKFSPLAEEALRPQGGGRRKLVGGLEAGEGRQKGGGRGRARAGEIYGRNLVAVGKGKRDSRKVLAGERSAKPSSFSLFCLSPEGERETFEGAERGGNAEKAAQ